MWSMASRLISRSLAGHQVRQIFSTTTRALSSSPSSSLIISAVGQDRLGIVSDVTKLVTEEGGNVGESQAGKLGSYFSLMMMVTLPQAKIPDLATRLQELTDINASVLETPPDAANVVQETEVGYAGCFLLSGADNPGIVHKISAALVKHGLSIEKLETDQEIGPHGGTLLFNMRGVARAWLPMAQNFDVSKIKEELAELGDALNCEITMEDIVDESYQKHFYGS